MSLIFLTAHNAVVTCSVFAPSPAKILAQISQGEQHEHHHHHVSDTSGDEDDKDNKKDGYVVVSGDYDGDIKVFYVYAKPKQSSLPLSTSSAGK